MLREFISAAAFLLIIGCVITGFVSFEKNVSTQKVSVESVIESQNEAVLQ